MAQESCWVTIETWRGEEKPWDFFYKKGFIVENTHFWQNQTQGSYY